MRISSLLTLLLTLLSLTPTLRAQEETPPADVVVLTNGSRIVGTLVSMADSKLVFDVGGVGEVEIPLESVASLETGSQVTIATKDGEQLKRRITGLEGGVLQLGVSGEGQPAAPTLALDQAEAFNPPPAPKPAWKGSMRVGFALSDGNTERRSANAAANAERRGEIDRISLKTIWNYAEEKTGPSGSPFRLTERNLYGEAQYDYFLSDRSYLLATNSAEGDDFEDLSLRYTAGLGYGYQWIEEEDLAFSTEAGLSFFYEDFDMANVTSDYMAARVAYSLRWEINEDWVFIQDVQAWPSLERSDDINAKGDTRLQVSLTESMFAEANWQVDYDNTPVAGNRRLDNRYFLNIGWSF